MIKLGIAGACGKMGRRIYELASHDRDLEISLLLEKKGTPLIGKEMGAGLKVSSSLDGFFLIDCLIDFTSPESTEQHLDNAAKYRKALVVGTPGLSSEQIKKLQEVAQVVPIVFSPNMSVAVNVLFAAVPDVVKKLGADYSCEIVEAHHKAKKDVPSGTAKKFGELIAEASHREIPIHAMRLGDIVGDHTIVICGNSERIEIKHQAHSRDVFALGALRAAKWVMGKPAGLYSMRDVLQM
jgi:4-hydroxy-tetrahydrodipicolinate reductase